MSQHWSRSITMDLDETCSLTNILFVHVIDVKVSGVDLVGILENDVAFIYMLKLLQNRSHLPFYLIRDTKSGEDTCTILQVLVIDNIFWDLENDD